MAKRGFPLTIGQVTGFAWCIAKERGKGDVFKKTGPSKKWWRGFKQRHPELRLRRPDSLERGRVTMGNVHSIREYFTILKETLNANQLDEKPHLIFNCDEAAINLNKSAGQRVVVPSSQKHAHSVAAATNEHITVHCCVSATGGTIPPMEVQEELVEKENQKKEKEERIRRNKEERELKKIERAIAVAKKNKK
ncbi:hypothetical protein MAR_009045 [Mya arenaria]|uniref:HTH CENPB-type domain-containing protein n=1 Tax=Mya arenaria TaxID=6604 RepID=A0ABY7E0X9_MYAAR|nr:hypothetical protein MAR_009045 [Mya arenaria]